MRLGEYVDFVVTPDAVQTLVGDIIDEAESSDVHASFGQLAPIGAIDGCADGVNLFCKVDPAFRLTIRLDWALIYAANVERIAAGFSVEHRGNQPHDSRWLVSFSSPDDPIADILYRILREICGCGSGELTYVYYPDPRYWGEA
jgi:hypothetical protein